jgi:hypothetical protein
VRAIKTCKKCKKIVKKCLKNCKKCKIVKKCNIACMSHALICTNVLRSDMHTCSLKCLHLFPNLGGGLMSVFFAQKYLWAAWSSSHTYDGIPNFRCRRRKSLRREKIENLISEAACKKTYLLSKNSYKAFFPQWIQYLGA